MPGIGAIGARCRHRPRLSLRLRRRRRAQAEEEEEEEEGGWEYQFGMVVLGDPAVGKSCLLRRFAHGRCPEEDEEEDRETQQPHQHPPTLSPDHFARLLRLQPGGHAVRLQLWDTAGQERFRSMTRSYYRNSVGCLLVFDITNRSSFEHVYDWLDEGKMHAEPFRMVFILVGHKCDLEAQRQVKREEAEELASNCGMRYIETSAKDATNVEESFTILTKDIYKLVKNGDISMQDGWEGVKSGFAPHVAHVEEAGDRCPC